MRVGSDVMRIPIIKLHGNLIISVQVALSDPMVQRLKDDVAEQIELTRPNGMAIDISGIDLMDSYISRAIRDVCIMAGLMGVHTVISGMDPMIAITLVEMDMGLEGVRTARDLEGALAELDREAARLSAEAAGLSLFDDAESASPLDEFDDSWLL